LRRFLTIHTLKVHASTATGDASGYSYPFVPLVDFALVRIHECNGVETSRQLELENVGRVNDESRDFNVPAVSELKNAAYSRLFGKLVVIEQP
jgi:hypothetical protein